MRKLIYKLCLYWAIRTKQPKIIQNKFKRSIDRLKPRRPKYFDMVEPTVLILKQWK